MIGRLQVDNSPVAGNGAIAGIGLLLACLGMMCFADGATAQGTDHTALFEQLDANRDARVTADEVPEQSRRLYERLLRTSDADGDEALSRAEFASGLTPQRIEKPMEEKRSGAAVEDAVTLLLLRMDTRPDARLVRDEVPEDLRTAFDQLAQNADRNQDGVLERAELVRAAGQLPRLAIRAINAMGIDASAELERLRRTQGEAAVNRFNEPQRTDNLREMLADPAQARTVYGRLDGNADGVLLADEVPAQLQQLFERLLQVGNRDGQPGLSEREFLFATQTLTQRRGQADANRSGAMRRGTRRGGRGRRAGILAPSDVPMAPSDAQTDREP